MTSISPDAHDIEGIDDIRFGVSIAKKARFTKERVINTMSSEEIEKFFKN